MTFRQLLIRLNTLARVAPRSLEEKVWISDATPESYPSTHAKFYFDSDVSIHGAVVDSEGAIIIFTTKED